ncbi:MAG: peptide chain release factor N(5)-glutamine methyltransferase [Betaproteobacteria bacterium]
MTEPATVRRALAQSGLVPVDAHALLCFVLGRNRAWLAAHGDDPLEKASADAFLALAKRRRDGEPVAYLVGSREFWGLSLVVSPAVLIPRPETETLVEVALARLPAERETRVLDLGTGSGAIALALAHERPRAQVLAVDLSADALAVAQENARRLGLANVVFLQSNWYANVPAVAAFDLIASNPPYVAARDPHLSEGDLRFEPASALASGADGLDALRTIVAGAAPRLVPGGALVVECGHDQSEKARSLFTAAGFVAVAVARDLAGIPRVVAGRLG